MAIRILFDSNHNPITPTILLANRSGKCYGMINNCYGLVVEDCFNDTPNFSLKVTKYDGLKVCNVWDKLVGLKLAYCVEWDMWFEIKVELDDGDGVIKTITFYGLGEAETSQIMLYDFQANTEDDIARDDYVPTVIYNEDNPKASLLNRIIDEKAPHYKIGHVDYSLRNIQRVFEFDDISIQEALLKIGTEIGALVVFDNSNDMLDNYHSKPKREISLYDLKNVCKECGERFDFGNSCPKCGSTDFTKPYGKDTPIFVSKDNLTEDIIFSTNVDSVKNCFRLVAGDDLMTATIKNCNPNGSQYIWYISDETKSDMPDELVQKLNSYNEMYDYYKNENIVELDEASVSAYNDLVEKYRAFDSSIPMMKSSICGFSELMEYVYNTIDFDLYLSTVLMETFKPSETNAALEASKLNSINLSPVAVSNITYISAATADNCVLEMARVLIDARYRVKINSSSFDKDTLTWTGNFYIERYSDEEDSATSNDCIVTIGDDYERYITQKIEKTMVKSDTSEYSISTVMKQDLVYSDGQFSGAFVDSIKKYSLMMLEVIHDCCQGCVDILIEQGIGNNSDETSSALYDSFYQKYYRRLQAIEKEQALRENEIATIENVHGNILDERDKIQSELDFEKYLGSDLWKVFCSYRRDDKYENDNFISDGLSNAELFQNALEFISNAEKEIYKSATLQNSISATLHNLLFIKGFEKLVDYFEVGNWIRIEVDGSIYKLRLLKYSIDFDNPERIDVEFSDVEKYRNGITDVKSILDQASSMASSYSYVSRQSSKGKDAFNTIDGWTNEGMSLTATKIMNDAYNQDIVWDSHGMLFRKYDSISGDFEPTQLKIVNNTLAVTDDYWETVKTAIGKFLYKNPRTGEIESAYGVNAETIVGTVILGEKLGIYNSAGTMSFDLNGFSVRNDKNEVLINPSADSIFTIKNGETDVLSFDANGNGTFTGNIVATSLELKPNVKIQTSNIDGLDEALGKAKSFIVTLSNEYQAVSNYNSSIAIDTTVYAHYGNTDVTNDTTFTIAKQGLDGDWNENEHIFVVTSLNEDNAYVEFVARYTNSMGEILTSKKRFNVSKVKDGENGKTWKLELSDLLIVQQSDFSISPTSINVSTYEIDDSGIHEYQGKIKISISTDGSTWSVVDNTTSSAYSYILPNTYQYKYVKFELFSNDDFLLDVQTITVNHDIATIFDELSEKIESSAVNITETTDENGHTIKNVSVGTGTGQKQFSVIDTSDFIYTDIAIGSKEVADAEEAYGAGKSFLKISKDGLIQASNALIYGTVYASGGKFTDVQGVNIDITGNSSFGGANGIKISNGKVVLGSDVDLSFLNGTTFLTKDSLKTDSLVANNLTISGNSTFSGTLSGADGTFSGTLRGADGTFSGTLSSVDGTFTGTLNGVNGTFSGTLSGATGSFSGSIIANSLYVWDSIGMKYTYGGETVSQNIITFKHYSYYEENGIKYSRPTVKINGQEFLELTGTSIDIRSSANTAISVYDGYGNSHISLVATDISFMGKIQADNIYCGEITDTITRYVQVENQYHSIQLRAGNAGNVGIRLDEGTEDACWLIYKDKNGNVQIPGFSSGGSVDLTGYATQSWVKSQGYLTQSSMPSGTILTSSNYSSYINSYVSGSEVQVSGTTSGYSSSAKLVVTSGGKGLWVNNGWLCYAKYNSGWKICIGGTETSYSFSDRRMKRDIRSLNKDDSYHILSEIEPCSFFINAKYQSPNERKVGIIAQDLRDVLLKYGIDNTFMLLQKDDIDDTIITTNDITLPESEYTYTIKYESFIPILWKGWQIHNDKLEQQYNEIVNLKARCEKLEYMLEQAFERITKLEQTV